MVNSTPVTLSLFSLLSLSASVAIPEYVTTAPQMSYSLPVNHPNATYIQCFRTMTEVSPQALQQVACPKNAVYTGLVPTTFVPSSRSQNMSTTTTQIQSVVWNPGEAPHNTLPNIFVESFTTSSTLASISLPKDHKVAGPHDHVKPKPIALSTVPRVLPYPTSPTK